MKVLLAHNRYCWPGGEDEVFAREKELLRLAGTDILEYTRDNSEIAEGAILDKIKIGLQTIWAFDSTKELRSLARCERPDVAHFHNTFPLISPGAYYVCQEEGIPVVQSLYNARLMCPAATCLREGRVCEDCTGKTLPWPGVVHACYRNSRLQTAAVAGMLMTHRLLRTWQERVDAYIVATEFFRQKYIAAGLPSERIFLKPHFLSADPGVKQGTGNYALFMGRLSPEKGIATLVKAWRTLRHVPLWIRGEGPMQDHVGRLAEDNPCVRVLPRLSRSECFDVIKGARFLVWPSEGYAETFGLVVMEAFACGTPVIGSRVGAMEEVLDDKRTGLHFTAGDPEDLAAKALYAWTHLSEVKEMGRAGRAEYETKYTAGTNYEALMRIYGRAMQNRLAASKSSQAAFHENRTEGGAQ
jgi:glycosyltransferase involved in cell wall biosynthesis